MSGLRTEDQVERLLTKANALRAAGDSAGAETTCREALALTPDHSGALELLGDILLARGQAAEALKLFRQAYDRRPERTVLEEKIALAALRSDDSLREAQLRLQELEKPQGPGKAQRNPALAFLLSAMLPGVGQMYNGDYGKGGVLFAVALFSFGALFYSATGMLAEAAQVGHGHTVAALTRVMQDWSIPRLLWALFNCVALVGTWTYSVIEAPVRAARLNAAREKKLGLV